MCMGVALKRQETKKKKTIAKVTCQKLFHVCILFHRSVDFMEGSVLTVLKLAKSPRPVRDAGQPEMVTM